MKNKLVHTRFYRAAILAVAMSLTAEAAPVEVKLWRELANYLQGKVVTITTKDGKSFTGRSFAVWPDAIVFNNGTPTKVSRDAVLSLHWETWHENQMKKLGKQMSEGYRHSGKLLGTSMGPFALAEVPMITAWGVVATPFCLLGDLFAKSDHAGGDISILPEPWVTK